MTGNAISLVLCLLVAAVAVGHPRICQSQSTVIVMNDSSPIVLDRVAAVVNDHVILASDIDDEIRLSVLEPSSDGQARLTKVDALQQLISRALIEQQIRDEEARALEPSPEDVNARLAEIRKQLPACARGECESDAAWNTFLSTHGLAPERVESYVRYRLEILRFVEQRFRQGIQISQAQIDSYYHDILLPQYGPGDLVPPQSQVAQRIEEILLQKQVNVLFDKWLTNLRRQGDVEILDPELAMAMQATDSDQGSTGGNP